MTNDNQSMTHQSFIVRYDGIIWSGEWYLLAIQSLATVIIIVWSMASTFFLLFCIDLICPIRMAEHMELLGADYCEHNVFHPGCGVTRAVSVLQHVPKFQGKVDTTLKHVGNNQGHDMFIQNLKHVKRISPMATNPVRRALISAAEKISRALGFMKTSSSEDGNNIKDNQKESIEMNENDKKSIGKTY